MLAVSRLALGSSLALLSQAVTPVQKVITLLENLKTEIEAEGVTEAGTYDKFAIFCKDTTKTKSDSIIAGKDSIDSLSATIGEKTSDKEDKASELQKRKQDQEETSKELDEEIARCAAAKAEYDAKAADLSKAISSLEKAVQAMESSKSFLAVSDSVKLAAVMDFIDADKRHVVNAFLQTQASVDPNDPVYKYNSKGILDILNKLLVEFKAKKTDVDTDWGKTKGACTATKDSLSTTMQTNQNAMGTLVTDMGTLTTEIAAARDSLITEQSTLEDDQLYIKDLTQVCEARAKDWDQRSQMRADEIEALAGALAVLKDDVKGRDEDVNKRALLETVSGPHTVLPHGAALSFVQEVALVKAHVGASAHGKGNEAVSLLRSEGRRLQSSLLGSVAARIMEDPFTQVKKLIQKLVERLLAEATAEATKKGFCDEELGKAFKDRDSRLADTKKLNAELNVLETTRDELTADIEILGGEIEQLTYDLGNATEARQADKEENLATIKTAGEGRDAVEEAISILKVYYARAAKAKLFLQVSASPVDEDTTGAGFEGAYKGKQESSKGIIGMLDVIKTDFARTKSVTEAAEAKAHADHVKFDRTSRADISGKQTKKELNEQDLETTKNKIAQGIEDLQTAQNLLDFALKTVEDLKPTCIDTGMSFAERTQKREEEIAALKNALTILTGTP